jgi:hypothetical protein
VRRPLILSRRNLLKSVAGAAMAGPFIVSASALGAGGRPAASNRIGIAHIGVGGRGSGLMGGFLGNGEVQVLAVCDTDSTRLGNAKKRVEGAYSQQAPGTYAGCKDYKDFLAILDRPDIDGIVVATPDHWHGLIIAMAAKAGKDIYSEKPFASTIGDGRAAADAIKRYGRVFQTGSHERSTTRFTPSAPTCPRATNAPAQPAPSPSPRGSTMTAGSARLPGRLTTPNAAMGSSAGSWITRTAN